MTSFSNIIREQNIQLLRTICYDYNWDYDDLYNSLLKNDNIFSNLILILKFRSKIRNQWIYKNVTYYVEEDSNNVYLNDVFQGKKFGENYLLNVKKHNSLSDIYIYSKKLIYNHFFCVM